MRVLTGRGGGATDPLSPSLSELYAEETTPWLRANMVSTVDGAGTGADGLTGSINNEADHRVFRALRGLADAVLVGAGTAEAEGYRPGVEPLVLVTGRARLPARLRGAGPGQVLMVTCASAPGCDDARRMLGDDRVLVCGDDEVDLGRALSELHGRGLSRILCEGGPRLLGDLLAAGLVDELCTTVVPEAVGGAQRRIVTAPDLRVPLDLRMLAEDEGTVFARWTVRRPGS
jgi:riboflavin biosynthesis pyrimidine reductase